MTDTILLFNRDYELLGEVVLGMQGLSQVRLSALGNRVLHATVEEWHREGIRYVEERETVVNGSFEMIRCERRVTTGEGAFKRACVAWASEQGYLTVLLSIQDADVWGLIAQLPLQPVERFGFLLAYQKAGVPERKAWWSFFENALQIQEAESKKASVAIRNLRKQTAEDLIRSNG
ncbi:hypothetical protein GF380_04535 [Candidatus Uhrbacteria bacterium]|nr:hypothetical protein [Candidatus Uhrbacteria bacterium]MBD3284327.1 hypothetical protein [Candidatus Uhrbacteria bacterium]